jgi:hypothetical protein
MKKSSLLIIVFVFALFSHNIFCEDWKKKLEENKFIQKMDKIEIKDKKIVIEGMYIRKVRITKVVCDTFTGNSEILITKKDLEDSFKRKNKDIKTINLTITKDGVLIGKGKANVIGTTMDIYIEGTFLFDKGRKDITYFIKKATVSGFIPVPESILTKFSKKLNPIFDIDKIGLPMNISTVIYESDKIVMK